MARVCVDVPLAHLDRPFDYLVAAADDEAAQPGVRVKVRFAGQLVSGFLLERAESSPHGGKLAYLDKIVSPERVLDPEVARLARAVADRYAGNLCDVLRLAVPPRHARVESQSRLAIPETRAPAPVTEPAASEPAASEPAASEPVAPGRGECGLAADPGRPGAEVAVPGPAVSESGWRGPVPEPGPSAAAPREPGREAEALTPARHVPGPESGSPSAQPRPLNSDHDPAAPPEDTGHDPAALSAGTGDAAASRHPAPHAAVAAADNRSPGGGSAAGPSPDPDAATGSRPGDAATGSPSGDAATGSPSGDAATGSPPGEAAIDPPPAERDGWRDYQAGPAYLRALEDGRPARAVWSALPGEDWPARIAEAAAATVRAGRGVVVVVADARDLDRLDRAMTTALGPDRHVALNAAAGPSERYRRFLAASRHRVPVVVGTRAAMFAPVAKLGLVVIWDDGDDLHAEPRSPYPHAREVLLTRAQLADCAVLVGGFARTGEAQLLLETGWAKEIAATRDVLRGRTPHVAPTGDDPQLAWDPGAVTARLPSLAWQAARQALQAGTPVLVQVPRRGYLPSVACGECRTPARCPHCSGPLGLAGSRAVPACHWCGRAAADYACPACGGRRLRASVTGARRTAEELGRAFPGAVVRTSGRDEVLDTVPREAAVVVSTPGAEPVADGGYGAVLLLDTWALLSRSDLRAAEETMRRWLNASALARPGGRVVVVADGSLAPVQALLRWEPGWFAARELAERRELRFPPAARMASLTGRPEAVAELLNAAELPADAEVLGPVPADDDQERMLVRVSRGRAAEMARALHAAASQRTARKAAQPVRIQIDPADLF
ncbi:primosomal protein N' [Jidongwangia harbinensis]|uniref:primosomal protein N' family DNA-binding protein n=1 Tax=Jidongwangia harbinensis TaxID=2878561 RepID=UPI001CD9A895|nr:primosomal protein N' [Jidongwangia harbinensis]MCA2217523.1 primosomal protein N' [Jidongwangia harbinensis]